MAVDRRGRMDLDALDELLRTGRVGTVVLTAGTTGLGAIDPIHEALGLCPRHGARVHVDAAYGGFFTPARPALRRPATAAWQRRRPWRAIAECDSVVVDPHKHGLQPYGCGAVLFRRSRGGAVLPARLPVHLLHLRGPASRARSAWSAPGPARPPRRCGSPSGCCRRPRTGWGRCSRPGRRAALAWSALIGKSDVLELYQAPELDIVSYFPVTAPAAPVPDRPGLGADPAGRDDRPRPGVPQHAARSARTRSWPGTGSVQADAAGARILRSVLMKPEAEGYVPRLHERVEQLARG